MITYIHCLLKIFFVLNLIAISFHDVRERLVPWKGIGLAFIISGINLLVALAGTVEPEYISPPDTESALLLIKGGGLILILSLLLGLTGCLGGGDIWLFWATGLMVGGKEGILIFTTSFLLSGTFIIILALFKKQRFFPVISRHASRLLAAREVAFVPFITMSVIYHMVV